MELEGSADQTGGISEILDKLVEARRAIADTWASLRDEVAEQIHLTALGKSQGLATKLNIIDVVRAVLILVNKEKKKVDDNAILQQLADAKVLNKVLNYDEESI